MDIDKKTTVEKVAHLARLELSNQEKQDFIEDMDKIITYFGVLSEVDTQTVGIDQLQNLDCRERLDEITENPISHDKMLGLGESLQGRSFRVPKIIE